MIPGLSTEKCEQRRRIIAQREEAEGAAIRFLANASDMEWEASETAGILPDDIDSALRLINQKLPEGSAALSADDVYIHYIEAASNNFIGDRYAFLSESTLRNIAEDATAGFAFMNSHRTGSLSTPSELPFGKTFAGQYRAGMDGQGRERKCAVVGVYMMRNVKPNGDSGPSTDDMHAMILGGQVADVSVGLNRGDAVCDVCASPLSDCSHYPGTRRAMTDDQIEAQQSRGVPGGRASYTIDNARCGEVSAVYDGAVPGAGVKKVMLGKRAGKLNHREWKEARQSFGSLLGDFSMDEEIFAQLAEAVKSGVQSALNQQAEEAEQKASAPRSPALSIGVETMSEERQSAAQPAATEVADNSAALTALEAKLKAEFEAKLLAVEADKAKAEQEAKLASERIAKLEAAAQREKFALEVAGKGSFGTAWFGDGDKHVAFLEKLSTAFGTDSDEVKFYVDLNHRATAAITEGKLLETFGSDSEGDGNAKTAWQQVDEKAVALMAADVNLSKPQAIDRVLATSPDLYKAYIQEGGK